LQNRSGNEEWIAFWIDAIIRDATAKQGFRSKIANRMDAKRSAMMS
jgi:hypothetical protein